MAASTTYRMLPPPGTAAGQNKTFNGRNYAQTTGNFLDVPDFDMPVLRANGWVVVGLVGTTAQRPAKLPAGIDVYVDTTIGAMICHDGNTWRNYLGVSV